MVDLSSPSPLVMTHYELVAFCAALAAVALCAGYDVVMRARGRRKSRATSRSPRAENPRP